MQCENTPLSRRQWMVRGQCIHLQLSSKATEPVILWSQCPFSKWHHVAVHLGSARTGLGHQCSLCHEQVEENGANMPVAIRHEACK